MRNVLLPAGSLSRQAATPRRLASSSLVPLMPAKTLLPASPGSCCTAGFDAVIEKFAASTNSTDWPAIAAGSYDNVVVDGSDNVYVAGIARDGTDGMKIDWYIKKFTASGTEITAGSPPTMSVS